MWSESLPDFKNENTWSPIFYLSRAQSPLLICPASLILECGLAGSPVGLPGGWGCSNLLPASVGGLSETKLEDVLHYFNKGHKPLQI